MTSASSNGGPVSPSSRENDAIREDPTAPSTSGGASAGPMELDTAVSVAEAARVSPADEDEPVEARVADDFNQSTVLREGDPEIVNIDASGGDVRNQSSSSITKFQNKELKKTKKKKINRSADDYDSMLSEFDQFAAKGADEAVGRGYEIGDMVWGKVKSHPWWPGHIYSEVHASPSVQRSKREGHVLVAFFGDGSYGWYEPAELIPFEENFAEKSQQTSSRPFLKAVGEAVDELSRRRGLGLACRCRNEFNFWPSGVEEYFVVDVGDYEPVVYHQSQINKARKDFHPNEMLSFVKELALTPMGNHQQRTVEIEFIKNKATALACRRALFEEFDETYAQAFGTTPVPPPRPTAPVAVNPSKAPLSGRLVTPEALGKKKYSIKPAKTKDEVEKDKYIFKRRDEPIPVKTKKASSGQSGPPYPLLVDASGLSGTSINHTPVSDANDAQRQSTNETSMVSDIKPLESSKKVLDGKMKKPKLLKQRTGELSTENAALVVKKKKKRKKEILTEQPYGQLSSENVIVNEKKKKRKKETRNEASMDPVKLPLANNEGRETLEKVPELPASAADDQHDNKKNDGSVALSTSSEAKQVIDLGKEQLVMLLRDLHALAINPFHGAERGCQATALPLFLKYRSIVYQKSLVLLPPGEIEKVEADLSKAPSTAMQVPAERTSDKSTMKLKRTLVRPDDPTIGGRKRGPPSHPDAVKKKRKLDDSEDINRRKKLAGSEDIKDIKKKKKKKVIDDSKLVSSEKKTLQRSTDPQRGDVKDIRGKNVNVIPAAQKVAKAEPGKRMQQPARVADPTMLVMKFPPGAALPSGAHLRAKFARFGPLDHSATRVFWETYTCRLVYQRKADAEAALEFAVGSGNLFGSRNVRSYIREVRDKSADAEAVKLQKESEQQRAAAGRHPVETQQQLKSCLKKATNEEVGNGNGNGNGKGARVKFILGGEGGSKGEEVVSSSYPVHDVSSKYSSRECVVSEMQKIPVGVGVEVLPKNDISQQLLNLLTKCRDVVNNLTLAFGHVPYHSL